MDRNHPELLFWWVRMLENMCDTDYDLILDGFSQNSYLAHPQRLLLCNTPSHVHSASHDAAMQRAMTPPPPFKPGLVCVPQYSTQ